MGRPQVASDRDVLRQVGRIVSQAGVSGVTFAGVAEQVGVSPSALAQRFGSRRGLLLAFARLAAAEVAGSVRRPARETPSPIGALLAALMDLVQGIERPDQLANQLSFLELDLYDPEFRQLAATHAGTLRGELAEFVRAAISAGELPPCDPEAVARLVHIVYNGALIAWAIEPAGALTDFVRSAVEAVLRCRTSRLAGNPVRPRAM